VSLLDASPTSPFQLLLGNEKGPVIWKIGVMRLLGKKNAEEDPKLPKNFRPIALTSCIGKVFTSLLKQRWMDYMRGNCYLNTAVQKAFVDCVQAALNTTSNFSPCWLRHAGSRSL
jgi:hypothetical protein